MTAAETLAHLASLTQLYLLQEYASDARLSTDRETFNYFRNQAVEKKKQASAKPEHHHTPVIQKVPPRVPTSATIGIPAKITETSHKSDKPAPSPLPSSSSMNHEQHVQPSPTPAPTKAVITDNVKPQKPPTVSLSPQAKQLELEPLTLPTVVEFTQIRMRIVKLFPHYPISDNIPSDEQAQQLSLSWKHPPVILLHTKASDEEMQFLSRLCNAIQTQLAPVVMLSGETIGDSGNWERLLAHPSLQLVLATPSSFQQLSPLHKYHRIVDNVHYLQHVKLLLTDAPSEYALEPAKKVVLWQTLRRLLLPVKQ